MRALLVVLLAAWLLAACGSGIGRARAEPAAAKADQAVGEVDYSCTTDADCEVKNVGNCCGYYPACVNRDSPTFPEQVRAACEREGRMAVCGFPSISGCVCRNRRCEALTGPGGDKELQ